MNRKKLQNRLRFGIQYFPLTLNCLLVALAFWWCYDRLSMEKAVENAPMSFAPFLKLMGKTALWFLLALAAFGLLSALICYLQFLWLHKKRGLMLQLNFEDEKKLKHTDLSAFLQSVRRPWLGNIRCRLVYDDGLMTAKLALLGHKREKGRFFRVGVFGRQPLFLPDIESYELEGSFVYFEDWLHLFSFAVFMPQQGHFHQSPHSRKARLLEAQPQQVKREDIRVEESKPIPGDYFNYKNFEGGDDIRRIVWQVYAKSRELVVRIPERRDFFASHLSFYASFYTAFSSGQRNNVFATEMLNFYKNCIWTAIETLLNKKIPLCYLPDQPLAGIDKFENAAEIQKAVSNAGWQNDKDLQDYFPAAKKGIIVISSFSEPEDIHRLLESIDKTSVIYFVPLAAAFRHWISWGWLKRIFVKPPADRLKRIRSRWTFAPLRLKIVKREKQILSLLEEYDVKYGVLQ